MAEAYKCDNCGTYYENEGEEKKPPEYEIGGLKVSFTMQRPETPSERKERMNSWGLMFGPAKGPDDIPVNFTEADLCQSCAILVPKLVANKILGVEE